MAEERKTSVLGDFLATLSCGYNTFETIKAWPAGTLVEHYLNSIDPRAVGLVVPTLNAGSGWQEALAAIACQSLQLHRLLVIDSESNDTTTSLAAAAGFEILRIRRSEFNHGGTRQLAADHLWDCGIIIFLTQDAVLADPNALSEIIRCFDDPTVAVAYGRQLPHKGATAIEAHARIFNYGPSTLMKHAATVPRFGTKVFFCSNSFAAYRRSTFVELGGFRRDLILGEDMEYAARAIEAGYSNVYCATAPVYHSHDYTLLQILKRYFDIGVFDEMNSWMRRRFGSHRGEGMRFIKSEFSYLASHAPGQIPRALTQTIAKLAGYRLGRMERAMPNQLKRRLSMFPRYWD